MDRPSGFSKRRVLGIQMVGMNCAFCHVSTLRRGSAKGMPDYHEDKNKKEEYELILTV